MLEATNLGCVRGDRRLFKGVNFSLTPGTFLQLQGPNGSGKTSLLRIICGLLAQAEGEIRWQGANISSLGDEYFTAVTYVGHRNGVKDELSGLENLRVSNALNGIEINEDKRLLSEGQRRRVALARLIVCNTTLWLLDEVLTSLDTAAISLVRSLIEEHLSNGGMAIVATHQELALSAVSSQRLELAT